MLRGVQHKVLDDGMVMLVDYMGEEAAIVQAARVSYGAGTKSVNDDVGLIRYLMQHRHTTPFEMCELKFLIRCPMDVWRQWIRHRTACLTGDTKLSFDAPNKVKHYQLTLKEIYDKFQPTKNETRPDKQRNPFYKADRVSEMRLRCVNEQTMEVTHTSIVDIWESGIKDIYEVTLADGNKLKASEDHLCFTDKGWLKVKDLGSSKVITIKSSVGTGVIPSPNHVDESVEIWEPVLRWEDYYEVSNEGRVKRIVGGKGSKKGRPKKVTISNNDGNFRAVVSLNRPGVQETKLVHQLMAEAFLGEGLPGQEVCHNDGNSLNNVIENLRWDWPSGNAADRIRDGATTSLSSCVTDIVSIIKVGSEMTYDIEVEGPWHNFCAEGMIVHNSVNEYSTRYSEAIDSRSKAEEWRAQATINKQGSKGTIEDWPEGWGTKVIEGNHPSERFWYVYSPSHMMDLKFEDPPTPSQYLSRREFESHDESQALYQERLLFGVAREQARKDLPLSTYTEAYWKIDLHNLIHFLGLRMDSHAQYEIRMYANQIGAIVQALYPNVWEAFKNFRMDAVTFYGDEIEYMKTGVVPTHWSKRRETEFLDKKKSLGIV